MRLLVCKTGSVLIEACEVESAMFQWSSLSDCAAVSGAELTTPQSELSMLFLPSSILGHVGSHTLHQTPQQSLSLEIMRGELSL